MGTIKMRNKNYLLLCGVFLISFAIVAIFYLFSQNTVITVGEHYKTETSGFLSCIAENLQYPFFTYDNTDSKKTEIKIIFNEDNIESLSLIQTMYYATDREAVGSEAINHGSMNISFGSELGPDALSARYSVFEATMQMTLYIPGKNLNDNTKRYFMINNISDNIVDLKNTYEEQSFSCIIKK